MKGVRGASGGGSHEKLGYFFPLVMRPWVRSGVFTVLGDGIIDGLSETTSRD